MEDRKLIVYDLEVLPNLFLGVFEAVESDKVIVCEISERRNDIALFKTIASNYTLVGYNNHGYDDIFINKILNSSSVTNEEMYELSRCIITKKELRTDKEKRTINKWKYINDPKQIKVDSIDVMTMLASSKLRVSLKHLQVKTKWKKVQDFDVDWTKPLPIEQFDICIDYCKNDVASLKHVAKKKEKDFKLRKDVQAKYGLDFRSMDGVKIAETLLCTHIAESKGLDIKEFMYEPNERITKIEIAPLINDFISFKTKPFQQVLEYFKSKTIEHFDDEKKNKKQLSYRVYYNGVYFDLGLGGIHAKSNGELLKPNDDEYLEMPDVSSFYPSQIVKVGYVHPHDPYFIEKYSQAYQDKIDGKREGDYLKETLSKLQLNSSFGKMLSVYSPLYSPDLGYRITCNGQLMLLMFIEMLTLGGFKVVGANTDAVEVIIKRSRYDEYLEICKEWEKITKMSLDHEKFYKIYRVSCNNYIGLKANDKGELILDENNLPKVKLKSDFEEESDLLKGYSYPVVRMAMNYCFIRQIEGEQLYIMIQRYIKAHKNIYNFCMSTKLGMSKKTKEYFNTYHKGQKLQKTNRYYAGKGKEAAFILKSSDGVNFQHVLKDSKVIIMNDYVDKQMKDYNINYDFYIEQARKIADKIVPQQLSLF